MSYVACPSCSKVFDEADVQRAEPYRDGHQHVVERVPAWVRSTRGIVSLLSLLVIGLGVEVFSLRVQVHHLNQETSSIVAMVILAQDPSLSSLSGASLGTTPPLVLPAHGGGWARSEDGTVTIHHDYTVDSFSGAKNQDKTILVDGVGASLRVKLSAATFDPGRTLLVQDISGIGNVHIDAPDGATIDGVAGGLGIGPAYGWVELHGDGTKNVHHR